MAALYLMEATILPHLRIMESIVIHWTRLIKDDSSSSAENSGPLD